MAAMDDLKTAWTTLIAAQYAADSNAISYHQARVDLDSMILAMTAYQALSTSSLQSYTIAGRSVTRAQMPQMKQTMDTMRLRLERYCRNASITLDDFDVTDGASDE